MLENNIDRSQQFAFEILFGLIGRRSAENLIGRSDFEKRSAS
jgi:hypothetical protein